MLNVHCGASSVSYKFTDLVLWWTLFHEWYIYVEDVFVQFILGFTRDACFRVIRAIFFFLTVVQLIVDGKLGNFSCRRFFFSVIFGVFVPFSSTATTIRPAFSSTYSLIHSCFVSQAVCTLYNLTDCAYANIQFRFVFKGFYFEKLVLTKIESTIEYMVFGSSYLHRVCERRFMLFFFKWPHFRIHWEWFLLNALHRGISNAIVLLKLIQNIHALSLCWKWTHLFDLNAMHHVAACINDLWRYILLM